MDRYEYNKEDITEGEIQAWILSNTEGLEINPYSEENRKRFIANEKALCDIKMLEVNK